MKPCSLILLMVLSLIGCSSTYQVADYPTKEEYHNFVNSSIKDGSFTAITNDSTFTCSEGSKMQDDSLIAIVKIQGTTIFLKDVKETKYFGEDLKEPSAYILLKSGASLSAENVKILPDHSIQFTNITNEHIPLIELKQISFTDHWKGVLPGIASGFLAGYVAGVTGLVFNVKEGQMHPKRDYSAGGLLGGLSGMIIGGLVGYIIGGENVYLFNP